MDKQNEYRRYDEALGEPVLDHEYDGIEELDNPLPRWWLWTFYGAIVYSALYFAWHNILNDGHLAESRYQAQVAAIEATQQKLRAEAEASLDEVALSADLRDDKIAVLGKPIFEAKCASCHGAEGGGLVGPNLTDAYWIHGRGEPIGIYKVIRDGVNAKGMPPWGGLLDEKELMQVSAYVVALKGSSPAQAKAPQGEKVE